MRSWIMFALLFCLALPSMAQEENPVYFAYLSWHPEESLHDLHLMNAATGEIAYEIASDDEDCPVFFPDANTYLYQQMEHLRGNADAVSTLLDLSTGESLEFSEGRHRMLRMESNGNQLAYHDFATGNIYLYNQETGETSFVDYVDRRTMQDWRFVGEDLYFVSHTDRRIYFQSWSAGELQTTSLERAEREAGIQLKISPDGAYLTVFYNHTNTLFLLDVATGEAEEIDRVGNFNSQQIHWHPDGSGFTYIEADGNVKFYNVETGDYEVLLHPGEFYEYIRLFWSPDSAYLGVLAEHDSAYYIHIIDMETGEVLRLPYNINILNGEPEWISPRQFVFVHAQAFGDFTDIYLYDMNSSSLRQMTNTPDYEEHLGCMVG